MVILAPAKLNLYLELLGKLPTGYHALETVMTEVSWYDSLVLTASSDHGAGSSTEVGNRIEFQLIDQTSGGMQSDVPVGAGNLVVRALELLQRKAGIQSGICATLIKRIPSQAGLGGGSSDAAAALKGGNQFWGLGLSQSQLLEMAAELGSDVPFFIVGGLARCTGRGEHVEPLSGNLSLVFVVVKPPVGLSTAEVFRRCSIPTTPHCSADFCRSLKSNEPRELGKAFFNRLAEPAGGLTEWVGRLGRSFERTGSLGWLLSGSGSACFGAYASWTAAQRAAHVLKSSTELNVQVVRPLVGRGTMSP